ncbi:sigma-70 family RNA polymerase sigma factor [Paenibacillus sp. QZ-Y1]|uniref:sigma-70 family RNA polymerase sigma factor n=1 Tax=Paenibacillus sp. QZ-Y1 TaxID=3414511 RepID=UPI003F79D475
MNFNNMLKHYDKDFNNEENIKLAKETNNEELKDKVISNNIKLVAKMANDWASKGSDEADDLVGIGMIALINAYNTYDCTRDIKFTTYLTKAVWMEFVKHANKKKRKGRDKYSFVSMDGSFIKESDTGSDKSIADLLSNDSHLDYEKVEDSFFNRDLNKAIDSELTMTEQKVSRKYFLEGRELVEIGVELNVSRQAVHQAFKRSVKKLTPVFA